MKPEARPPDPHRRGFLTKAACAGIGAVTILVPAGAGLMTLLDPLRRKGSGAGTLVHVTSIQALPEDGTPRQFPIVADRQDAWNKFPQVRIGAVYLRRTGPRAVEALNVVCPHAGCFVNYKSDERLFLCPCHDSRFALDGSIQNRSSPSPRPMDALEVELRNDSEVWVRFRNFQAGSHQKIPVA